MTAVMRRPTSVARGALLPAEPFLALVERELQRRQWTLTELVRLIEADWSSPRRELMACSMYRRLYGWRTSASRGEPRWVRFEVADRLITRLCGPESWFTLPELAELYGGGVT